VRSAELVRPGGAVRSGALDRPGGFAGADGGDGRAGRAAWLYGVMWSWSIRVVASPPPYGNMSTG